MSKTISRNYRDRTSPYKWLVRDTDKPIETAIAAKRVVARKVQFTASNRFEAGFGCGVVAVAESAQVIEPEVRATKRTLAFDRDGFRIAETGQHVGSVDVLELGERGEMIATFLN